MLCILAKGQAETHGLQQHIAVFKLGAYALLHAPGVEQSLQGSNLSFLLFCNAAGGQEAPAQRFAAARTTGRAPLWRSRAPQAQTRPLGGAFFH